MSKSVTRVDPGWYRIREVQPGSYAVEVQVDLLPPPQDSFFADWFAYELVGRTVTFRFGKVAPFRPELRAVLEVAMSLAHVPQLAESFGGTFRQNLEKFRGMDGAKVEQPELDLTKADAKAHSVVATFASVAFSDSDAVINFYRFPPTEGAKLAKRKGKVEDLNVIPVVRIDTTTPVLFRLDAALSDLAAKAAQLGLSSQ